MRRLAAALLMMAAAMPAAAITRAELCSKADTIERWGVGGGFSVLPKSGHRLFVMQLLGESLTPNPEVSGVAMQVDGIFYQILFVPIDEFSAPPRKSDEELLDEHAKWEFDAAQKAGAPLHQFLGIGRIDRPASEQLEAATFKLWRTDAPGSAAMQLYGTTVVGDEIVVMTAIVPTGEDAARQFGKTFRNFADTLDWVDCDESGR